MNRYTILRWVAWSGLLILVACQALAPSEWPFEGDGAPSPGEAEPSNTKDSEGASDGTEAPPTPSSPTPPARGAGNADVTYVKAVEDADGTWTFYVTVHHPDTGWEDYADGWDVLTPEETILKPDPDSPFTRLLLHPHVSEQPFTRSQSDIAVPDEVTQVRVRAHDLVDGYGGREVVVDLTAPSGPDFEVIRQ